MKYLIAGLGNIGTEYENTRHNIGFDILNFIAAKENISFISARYADVAELKIKGRTCIFIKPTTYMNLSGKAIKYWMQKEKIPIENLLVLLDDINLPTGKIRIRINGTAGGHNGLKSIQELLETQNYTRLRFGCGKNFNQGQQVHFVLGKWQQEEIKIVEEKISQAADAVYSFILQGAERTMNIFNTK